MGNGRHLRFRRRVLPGHVDAQGNVPEFGIFQPGFPAPRREAVHDPGLHDLLISEEFHRRHGMEDMECELAETALEWWPWEPVFKMWQQELSSLSALWKTVSRKSGVSVGKFRRDMQYLICFLGFIKRDDLIEVLISFIYMGY